MLHHTQIGKEVKIVDHCGDVAPDFRRSLGHSVAAYLDAAIVRSICTYQAAQQGGFAGSVTSRECDGLSGPHLQAELLEYGVGPEGPAQAGHLEDRRAFGHGGDSASFRQKIRTNLLRQYRRITLGEARPFLLVTPREAPMTTIAVPD